ncbi:insulin-induced protein-domain-containing protein [Zopfochytrium polystomum]|nr:insulin-induced protein-domain-containing protein [Zopfochytrium polystomum]
MMIVAGSRKDKGAAIDAAALLRIRRRRPRATSRQPPKDDGKDDVMPRTPPSRPPTSLDSIKQPHDSPPPPSTALLAPPPPEPLASSKATSTPPDPLTQPPTIATRRLRRIPFLSRILVLFFLGTSFSFLTFALQRDAAATSRPPYRPPSPLSTSTLNTTTTPPTLLTLSRTTPHLLSGLFATLVGLLLPHVDALFSPRASSSNPSNKRDWPTAARSLGALAGLLYATAKLPGAGGGAALALVAVGVWWVCDGSGVGFVAGTVAAGGVAAAQAVAGGLMLGGGMPAAAAATAWLPCVVMYGSCVCFGAVGRQLAREEEEEEWDKED